MARVVFPPALLGNTPGRQASHHQLIPGHPDVIFIAATPPPTPLTCKVVHPPPHSPFHQQKVPGSPLSSQVACQACLRDAAQRCAQRYRLRRRWKLGDNSGEETPPLHTLMYCRRTWQLGTHLGSIYPAFEHLVINCTLLHRHYHKTTIITFSPINLNQSHIKSPVHRPYPAALRTLPKPSARLRRTGSLQHHNQHEDAAKAEEGGTPVRADRS